MMGALAAVEVVSAPSGIRTAVRCAFVLVGFAAMAAWVRLNRVALDQQNWCACAGKTITVRVIASRRPERQPVPAPLPIGASDQWLLDEEQVEEASVP